MTDPLGASDAKVLTPDRWRLIEPILDAALELPPEQRSAYVHAACASDASLLAEVEHLLAMHDVPGADFDTSAAERFASLLDEERHRLPEMLGGRYKIGRVLGRGGMATVFLADDLRHERQVAVKVLHADLAAALGAELFLAEIKTTAQLHHPHILPLHDSGDADGLLYYVMPYVPGGTLRRRLAEGKLSIDDAVDITTEVASALDAAHRHGVIHCDIKPENILLHDGTALVADFGIAQAVSAAAAARMAKPGILLGTPQYMSPEQGAGTGSVDTRADVYSLGVVVYEMLAGHLPFEARPGEPIASQLPSIHASREEVPAAVDAVLARALAGLPADRYATAGELAAELRQGLTAPVQTHDADQRHAERGPRRALQLFVVAGVLLVVAGIALLQRPRSHATRPPRAANPQAEYYVTQGNLWFNKNGGRRQAVDSAVSLFKAAIELDSTSADAHAGLAHAYVSYSLGNLGDFDPEKFLPEARNEARRALALDSTVAEAHAELANVLMFYDMDWAGAEREAGRALELDSRSVMGRAARIILFEYLGRFGEAVKEALEYVRLQPQLERPAMELGRALFFDHQYADAAKLLRQTIGRDSSGFRPHLLLGEVLAEQAKFDSALLDSALSEMQAAVRHSKGSSRTRAYLANVYARIGRTAEAQRELSLMYEKKRRGFVPALDFAIAYVGLGNTDSTFAWLEKAVLDHSMRPYVFDPTFDLIRSDPRYLQLLRTMHLPYHSTAR